MPNYGAWSGLERSTRGLPDTALKLYDIKARQATSQAQQALTAKELGLKERQLGFERMKTQAEYGPGGLAERRVGATEAATAMEQKKLDQAAKMKGIAEGPFQRSNLAPIEGRIAMFDKQNKTGILKAVNPIMQYVKDAADMNATGADVYNGLKQSWPQHKEPVMKSLQEEYNKALMNDNKAAAQTVQGIMADLEKDGVIDSMMPGVAQYVKDKQAMAAAEIAQKTRTIPEKPIVLPSGSKLVDSSGKELAIGTIKKDRPLSIPPGGTLVDSSGKVIATGPPKEMTQKEISTEYRAWINTKKSLDKGSDLEVIRDILAITMGGNAAMDAIDKGDTSGLAAEVDKQIKYWGDKVNKKQGNKPQKKIKRTGTYQGRKVVEYEDGSVDYAD